MNPGDRSLRMTVAATTVRRPWLPDALYLLTTLAAVILAASLGLVMPLLIWLRPGTVPDDARAPLTGLVIWGWVWTMLGVLHIRYRRQEEATTPVIDQDQINAVLRAQYDPTAATVDTPVGPGKFIAYEPVSRTVWVEFDHEYVAALDADDCWLRTEGGAPVEASA